MGQREVRVKPTDKLTTYPLVVHYDKDAKQLAANELNADHWDDSEEELYFLAPHVYFKGKRSVLRFNKVRFEQLPGDVAGQLTEEMESGGVQSVVVAADKVELCLPRTLWLLRDTEKVQDTLGLLDRLISAIEQCWDPTARPGD